MKCTSCVCLLAVQASCVAACQRELLHETIFDPHPALAKRQEAAFPPLLEPNEAILSNSFDTASLETWSYYYTHGLHIAGTNKSMAQWTADRWNEFGFTAGLAPYCMAQSSPIVMNSS